VKTLRSAEREVILWRESSATSNILRFEHTGTVNGSRVPTIVCTENLNADVMVMKSAEQGV
jgi:hypothetical protein